MEAEERCIAAKSVQPSAYMEPESAIEGRGACGMMHPFKVSAMSAGYITVEPQATLACPIIGEVDRWLADSVQPASVTWFGEHVVEIKQISAYSCRPMNGQPGNGISEHAFGNALDVAMFKFASGREVKVKDGWKGPYEERGFLRQVLADACDRFTTVLGPGSNAFHYDHFHLDLARRSSGRTICNPVPELLPPPSILRQEMPIARQHMPQGSMAALRQPQTGQRYGDLSLGPVRQEQMRERTARESVGPTVIERRPQVRAADPPLSLAPPQSSRAASSPSIIEHQSPVYRAPFDPNRPVPPRNVGARLGGDPIATGSITKDMKKTTAPTVKAAPTSSRSPTASSSLMSPEPMANQKPSSKEPIEQATLRALKAERN